MPKVSVIIPIYNVEKYIDKCLKSIETQTIDSMEVILVNDGSQDLSGNIAKIWAERQRNILVKYVEKENGGLSDARNYGLKYATGEFVAFLDSDDYVESTIYEKMYNKAINNNADFVECNFVWEYPNKKREDIVKKSFKENNLNIR